MRRRFKFTFVILLVATVVWSLACYRHVTTYNQMIEQKKQQVGEEFFNRFFDYPPVWMWRHGDVLFMIGFFMFFAWMVFLLELYRLLKRSVRKMRLVKRLSISKGDVANIVVFLVGLGFYYSNIPIIRNMGGWLLGASVIIYIIRVVRKGKAEGKEVFIF